MIEIPPTPANDQPDGPVLKEDSISENSTENETISVWLLIWQKIERRGWTDPAMRIGTGVATIILLLIATWVMNSFSFRAR
jgi:hypothetical protein